MFTPVLGLFNSREGGGGDVFYWGEVIMSVEVILHRSTCSTICFEQHYVYIIRYTAAARSRRG